MKPISPTSNPGEAVVAIAADPQLAQAASPLTIEQFNRAHAVRVVDRFVGTEIAEAWGLFGGAVQLAFLDRLVLDDLRIAQGCGADLTAVTAFHVLAFQSLLQEVLAQNGFSIEGS